MYIKEYVLVRKTVPEDVLFSVCLDNITAKAQQCAVRFMDMFITSPKNTWNHVTGYGSNQYM